MPDFRVPIVLGGESHHLLVQDVPACVFWQGYPEPAPEDTDRDRTQAIAAWFRHLLVRVTLKPPLDLGFVLSWGDDYELPIERYLEAIGFTPKPVLAPAAPADLLDAESTGPRESLAAHAAYRGCVPPPYVRSIVRRVARSCTMPASQAWLMYASEFFFSYHVHLTDEEKAEAPLPEVKRA